jgi:hypothetical protein
VDRIAEVFAIMSAMESPRLRRLATGLLLFLLVAGAYWRIVFTDEYTWLDNPDLAYQVMPWFQMQAAEWHAGRFPLWDPYHWAGQPLLGQAQPGAAYPLNWILFSLPLHDGWIPQATMHWYLVVLHFIAAWGSYLLARELRCSRGASVLAGLVFSLSGWMALFEWPQMVNGAIWAPFVFRFLVRVVRSERVIRSSVLAGFFLGFSWLSGHHQIPIFISLAAGGVWVWVLAGRRLSWRTALTACAVFWVMAGATGALQILPAREYGMESVRWIGLEDPVGWETKVPYQVHRQFSLHPVSFLGIVLPGTWVGADPYLGLTAFALALLGVVMAWERREVRLFAAVAMGGLALALGSNSILHGLLYALVPMVDKARSPHFAVVLFGFGASILAAVGADRVVESSGHPAVRRAFWLLCATGGFLFLVRMAFVLSKPFDPNFDDRHLVTALAALLLAGLLAAIARGAVPRGAAAAGLGALILLELGMSLGTGWPSRYDKSRPSRLAPMAANADIVQFLRRQAGPYRVDVDDKELPYNFGDWHGIEQLGGYLASMTANVRNIETNNPGARRLLGVEYAIRRAPNEFYTEEVFTGVSGLKVFRNGTVYPRTWTVHEAVTISEGKLAPRWLDDPARDARKTAFAAGPAPALEACGEVDKTRVITHSPNFVRIKAEMACRGMLILSDTYFPGWKATVDGKPVRIHEAYTVVRGVLVEKGTHTVEFHYSPTTARLGGLLTAFGFVAALVAWRWRRASLTPALV